VQVLQEVQFLKCTHKPNILFILETMVNENNIRNILPQMDFEHFGFVVRSNHSGGVAVLWNNGIVCVSVLRKEQEAIHMLVHDTTKG